MHAEKLAGEELELPLSQMVLPRTIIMMKATQSRQDEQIVIKVEGRVAGLWVAELEQSWNQASTAQGPSAVLVELAGVSFVDEAGRELLAKMSRAGTRLAAAGCLARAIVEEVEAKPEAKQPGIGVKGVICVLAAGLLLMPGRLAAQKPPKAPAQARTNQTNAPITLKLTLHGAVVMALRQNPQVQISAIDLAQSQQSRKIARSDLLPQASLEVNDRAVRSNIEAAFGKPFAGFPVHIGPFQVFEAGTFFSMPIFDLTLWRHWQAAGHRVEQSAADRMGVREQVTLLVVSQYLASLRAMANVRAARSRVQLAQALYEQASDLQKHGVATGLDTLRANVELQNEQQNLIQSETAEKTSRYGLARLLNIDPHTQIDLTDQMSFYQTPPFTAAQSIDMAISNRPEMKAIDASELRLESDRQAARDQKLPSLSFNGQYLQQGVSVSTIIPTYAYEAHIELPIFTGGRIRAEEANADLDLAKLAQQKQDLVNEIALQVKTAVAQLDAARNEVKVANLGVALAQEEVSQSRDRFQAGVANNIEVVSAQDALARANNNQIGALYSYNEARANLARATGQIEDLYAK
jgi:outer membrane protein